jgi:flagellar motor component MotA
MKVLASNAPVEQVFISPVEIKNNPLETACVKYLAGDMDAFNNIDFTSAILPETQSEEIIFFRRAMELSEIARREGLLALDKHLDHSGIAALDVFEYGLPFIIDGYPIALINDILSILVERKTDPVQKNLALAKKAAILSISAGENPRILAMKIVAYLGITGDLRREILDECDSNLF